jgi:hypothetical protein
MTDAIKRTLLFMLITLCVGAQDKQPPLTISPNAAVNSSSVLVMFSPGPKIELILRDKDGKPSEIMRIKDKDEKVLITLHLDGSIKTENGFKADEAGADFWRAVALTYRPVCAEVLTDRYRHD